MTLQRHILSRSLVVGATVVVLVAMTVVGCQADSLSESEQQDVYDIYRSGLQMQADEFVRAETLRALELTDDERLAAEAAELLDDPDPVVRVGAVRTLLRTAEPDSPYNIALGAINHRAESEDERLQLVDIALTEGGERVRRGVLERAARDDSTEIRMRGLRKGLLDELQALGDSDDRDIDEYDLLDDLAGYLDDDDPEIAATALRALIEAGRDGRATAFVETLADETASMDERIEAGRVLVLARIDEARPVYADILDEADRQRPEGLHLPDPPLDDRLVRIAVLGKTILGDTDYVEAAQQYRVNADTDEALEVIEALGENPSDEAAISLRSDVRSSNTEIRRRAISLYGDRDDARADVFLRALDHDDVETRRRSIEVLTESFPDRFVDHFNERLQSDDPERIERTLRTLHRVLATEEGARAPIDEFRDRLEELAVDEARDFEVDDEDDEMREHIDTINNFAAYVLFRVSDQEGEDYREVIRENPDPHIRAAYLENLATHDPAEHADILRDHLRDDLYVLRLMAATGLWRAFGDDAHWPGDPETDDPDADEQDDD